MKTQLDATHRRRLAYALWLASNESESLRVRLWLRAAARSNERQADALELLEGGLPAGFTPINQLLKTQ